jgi:hypothetical protein
MFEIPETAEPEALVAGTLCLMSCTSAAMAPMFVRRIVANLEKLAGHPRVTLEMRTVCRRLAIQWEQRMTDCPHPHGPSPFH